MKTSGKQSQKKQKRTHSKEAFLLAYERFLCEDQGMQPASAQSYVSYLRGMAKKFRFEDYPDEDVLELIATCAFSQAEYLCELLIGQISTEQKSPSSPYPSSTLSNYKSAIAQIPPFLSSGAYGKRSPKKKTKIVVDKSKIHSTYSKSEVLLSFKSRLNTQDRFYEFGAFPCRLLTKIFKKRPEYRNLMESLALETKFHIDADPTKTVSLSQATGVELNRGLAYLLQKGNRFLIYTEIVIAHQSRGVGPLEAINFGDLSLDHDHPMHNVLKDNIDRYPALRALSEPLISFRASHPALSASKMANRFYLEIYPSLGIDENQLFLEVKDYLSLLALTVMQRRYNSSKNKTDL